MPMLNQAAQQAAPQGAPQAAPPGAGGPPPGAGGPPPGAGGPPPPGAGGPPPGANAPPPDPNIGKVDVTTPEGQADPNNVSKASGAAGAAAQARQQVKRRAGLSAGEEEASPEEQKEYDKALDILHQVLYEDPERSRSIAGMLDPRDKISTTVKTSLFLLQQIDEKADLDEAVIAPILVDLNDRLIEMGEKVHDMEFSEQETKAVAGATFEGVMEMFGMDASTVEEMTQGMSDEEISQIESEYKGYVGGNQ